MSMRDDGREHFLRFISSLFMSIHSVVFAVFLSTAVCQRNIVSLSQRRLPFQNGTTRNAFLSSAGTLRHIQTLQLDDAVSPISQFAQLSSIIVDSGGSELLATTDEATFITMELERTSRGRFDVSEATVYPMRDPQGEIMIFKDDFLGQQHLSVLVVFHREIHHEDGTQEESSLCGLATLGNPQLRESASRVSVDIAASLTIDGTYRGRGRGDLIVSFVDDRGILLRYPDGVRSRASTELNISDFLRECGDGPEAITKLRPRRRDRRDHLLMLCGSSTSDDRNVYTAYAYDESIPNRFFVESRDSFNPADMAGLRNGDFMILFSREDTRRNGSITSRTMRIGYVTSIELTRAIREGGTVIPQIILEVSGSDGFNIGRPKGLATREDRLGRIFVYTTGSILGKSLPSNPTILTTFEWMPDS